MLFPLLLNLSLVFGLLQTEPQNKPLPSPAEIAQTICTCGQDLGAVAQSDDTENVLLPAFQKMIICIGGLEVIHTWYQGLTVEDELAKEEAVLTTVLQTCPDTGKALLKVKK